MFRYNEGPSECAQEETFLQEAKQAKNEVTVCARCWGGRVWGLFRAS